MYLVCVFFFFFSGPHLLTPPALPARLSFASPILPFTGCVKNKCPASFHVRIICAHIVTHPPLHLLFFLAHFKSFILLISWLVQCDNDEGDVPLRASVIVVVRNVSPHSTDWSALLLQQGGELNQEKSARRDISPLHSVRCSFIYFYWANRCCSTSNLSNKAETG